VTRAQDLAVVGAKVYASPTVAPVDNATIVIRGLRTSCALTAEAWGRLPESVLSGFWFYAGVDLLIMMGAARDLVVNPQDSPRVSHLPAAISLSVRCDLADHLHRLVEELRTCHPVLRQANGRNDTILSGRCPSSPQSPMSLATFRTP
jgi:hypothetical protein